MAAATDSVVNERIDANPFKMLHLFLSDWSKNDRSGFVKALIDNSNDAIDVLNFLTEKDPAAVVPVDPNAPLVPLPPITGPGAPDFTNLTGNYISVIPDPEQQTLSFVDTGIGMTKEDLRRCVGVMGNSKSLVLTNEHGLNLIGRDGIGIYRCLAVANKVLIISKNPKDEQHVLEFNDATHGFGNYCITRDNGPPLGRGTKVVLYLRGNDWFLKPKILVDYVIKGSKMATYPVYVWMIHEGKGRWEIVNARPTIKKLLDLLLNAEHGDDFGWLGDNKGFFLSIESFDRHMKSASLTSANYFQNFLNQLNSVGFQVKKRIGGMTYDITHKAGLLDRNDIRKVLSISEQYKSKAKTAEQNEGSSKTKTAEQNEGSSKTKTAEQNEGSSKVKTAEENEGSSTESDADENEAEGIDENERED